MSLKVGLIDMDSKMENLALMKISAHEKAKGNKTQLIKDRLGLWEYKNFDKFYASCVFTKSQQYAKYLEIKGATVGGYGFNGVKLPDNVEHTRPDYSLYERDRSIGRKTKGCSRNCPWCVVPKMEGNIKDHAPISEFHDPSHKKIILLDNNILLLPDSFKKAINYIIDNGLAVCFNQGLDIRLINEENAEMLANCDYKSLRFKERRLYFAFDHPSMETAVVKGVQRLKNAGIPPGHVMFYILCGFGDDYTFAQDWHRFEVLRGLGVDPYVMKYNGRRDIRILNHFARWVILRDYKRKQPKYLRPNESQELQDAIAGVET